MIGLARRRADRTEQAVDALDRIDELMEEIDATATRLVADRTTGPQEGTDDDR